MRGIKMCKFIKNDFDLYVKKFDVDPIVAKDEALQPIINNFYKHLNEKVNTLDYEVYGDNNYFNILIYNNENLLLSSIDADLTQPLLFNKNPKYDKDSVGVDVYKLIPEANRFGEYTFIYREVFKLCFYNYLDILIKEFALFLKN